MRQCSTAAVSRAPSRGRLSRARLSASMGSCPSSWRHSKSPFNWSQLRCSLMPGTSSSAWPVSWATFSGSGQGLGGHRDGVLPHGHVAGQCGGGCLAGALLGVGRELGSVSVEDAVQDVGGGSRIRGWPSQPDPPLRGCRLVRNLTRDGDRDRRGARPRWTRNPCLRRG